MHFHPARYVNLVRNVRNWPLHLTNKFSLGARGDYRFVTRRSGLQAHVPGSLYGTFKEMFMMTTYQFDTLCPQLPKRPVVFDIGANIGLFSLALIDRIGDAVIHAFEPMPGNHPYLERNSESCRNGSTAEIHIHHCAVVAPGRPAEMPLFLDPDRSEYASASLDNTRGGGRHTQSITVPTTTIEAEVSKHCIERIDLLKLDCEGAEFEIILTLPPDLIDRISIIAMEVHTTGNPDHTPEAMTEFLEDHGYSVNVVAGRRAWGFFATRAA